jgi:hypothetical protein
MYLRKLIFLDLRLATTTADKIGSSQEVLKLVATARPSPVLFKLNANLSTLSYAEVVAHHACKERLWVVA